MNILINFTIVYGTSAAIILRAVSCVILTFFMIPLQIREARVSNGLRSLRIQLLLLGIILLVTNLITLYLLATSMTPHQPLLNSFLQVLNGLATLILSLIGYAMYHKQYTPESKKRHKKIEEIEKEIIAKKIKSKTSRTVKKTRKGTRFTRGKKLLMI